MGDASVPAEPLPRLRAPRVEPEPAAALAVRLAAYAVALRAHSVAYFLGLARAGGDRRALAALAFHSSSLAACADRERVKLATPNPGGSPHET
jgi:hypothetical protein